ncbi:MAG: carboxymuconolactone decarboxylase family protein [Gammaproteobacteria bacterium]|jgi:uncharacterized peroxidase-related enzyme|nr:carboxymuconolactone decarboxylase [Gammaproteobacteria bacterium]MDP6147184.1 carboxymuconolactone decarboxylase family protein [Gammaproteobacteria bacterium]HJL80714.1 carboxymuconolactone decarboxylase family protein [Gammaproteobacteria bacterium]HJM09105.1 carboxymuconolactone decarboxylase family protein [Gammaproteobacteria bacterium]HJN00916.1 carboxymuconolactone decarboxylase family protein [Gammaproteobacteria bacterium]|tara:strand:- start:14348 stop:14905 length:558 start_codon:yes stop_codon:yes gene_type:complete
MSRIAPAKESELNEELQMVMDQSKALMGFIPNDALIMAKHPELLHSVNQLVNTIYSFNSISEEVRSLVGLMASQASGCHYCIAHTNNSALEKNISIDKLKNIWEFETSNFFSDSEKAALRIALNAAQTPNLISDEDYSDFKNYYDENQQIEILAIISLFGFLNRWNSSLMTEIESMPLSRMKELE